MAAGIKGSYALVLFLAEDCRLTIGRLGSFEFPAGLYLYLGSALNGLEGRVRRHLQREKKLHWHIDYLASVAEIEQVWWQTGRQRKECGWAQGAVEEGGEIIARGFGSSDCRCETHLLRLREREPLERIQELVLPGEPSESQGVYLVPAKDVSRSLQIGENLGPVNFQ